MRVARDSLFRLRRDREFRGNQDSNSRSVFRLARTARSPMTSLRLSRGRIIIERKGARGQTVISLAINIVLSSAVALS